MTRPSGMKLRSRATKKNALSKKSCESTRFRSKSEMGSTGSMAIRTTLLKWSYSSKRDGCLWQILLQKSPMSAV